MFLKTLLKRYVLKHICQFSGEFSRAVLKIKVWSDNLTKLMQIDPLGRPMVMIATFTLVEHLSVHPLFSKTKPFSSENSDHYLRGCGSVRGDHGWHLSCAMSFSGISCWLPAFKVFLSKFSNTTEWRSVLKSKQLLSEMISKFLFSREGVKFANDFKFEDQLTCNKPAPKIKVDIFFSNHYIMKFWSLLSNPGHSSEVKGF